MKRLAEIGLATLTAALAGCGGGGGDGPSTPTNTAPAQIESLSVWKSFLSADRTYVTRGTGSDGAAYEISTTIRPRGTAQFGNDLSTAPSAYNSVEVTNAVKRNNAAYSSDSKLFYIRPTDFSLGAVLDPVNAQCIAADSALQSPPVPATASLNASGRLFSGTEYVYSSSVSQCTRNPVIRAPSHSFSWSYEADAGKPLFCVNYATTYPGDNRLQTSCFEVAGGNSLAGTGRVTLTAGTVTLTTKNY